MSYAQERQPTFYLGVHRLTGLARFERVMVSVNVLEHDRRESDFPVRSWIMDSGAFTRVTSGRGHMALDEYARWIRRFAECGDLEAAVSQDYMCEPIALEATKWTVAQHQKETTVRYLALLDRDLPVYLMPVVQGQTPDDYRRHLEQYGRTLEEGAWVGVGSVCKRNGSPNEVVEILRAISTDRPDLLWHGFGLKKTALASGFVRSMLYSCDSMAWSLAARKAGRDANSLDEAARYAANLGVQPVQAGMEGVR